MRVQELIGIVAAAALVVTAAVVAPAAAETVERDDRRGDAPASIDVVHATYSHTHSRVRVVVRVPDLGRGGVADLSISRFELFELGYVLRITNRPGQPPSHSAPVLQPLRSRAPPVRRHRRQLDERRHPDVGRPDLPGRPR